jgi:hypothetical protein
MNFADLQNWIAALYQEGGVVSRLWIEPFGRTVTFSALAAAASATQILQFNSNQDFVVTSLSHRANVAAAGQTVSTKTAPLVRIQITDVGSGSTYFGEASDLENVSSNAFPKEMPYPRWHAGNTSLSIVATNYDAAQAYNFDLFFAGVRVRRYSQPIQPAI